MFNRKINGVKKIYLLDGVNALLTSSALVYKRNLMYSSFLCLCLSLVAPDCDFQSLFGFKIANDYITTGSIIAVLLAVIVYEVIMLWASFSQCKAQWFGKDLIDKKTYFFKDSLDINLSSDIFINTSKCSDIQNVILNESEKINTLRKKMDPVISDSLVTNKDMYNKIHSKIEQFNTKLEEVKEYPDGYHTLKSNMKSHSYINNDLKNTIDTFEKIAKEDIHLNVKSWFIEASDELKKLESNYYGFIYKIYSLQGGYITSLVSDFILPSFFALISVIIAIHFNFINI
ncbi:hypothetical protein RND59_13495 [Vibrio ruber]|uniref:hypothetical protein n=1 Tax=Vibrio ruber TaxID=184755 RepID=UPI0028932C1B|nr:hypothetical protein [Vibrio ruber]WNJ95132.1 hypothetical protein RND59_13495 [Vibrio ruber]